MNIFNTLITIDGIDRSYEEFINSTIKTEQSDKSLTIGLIAELGELCEVYQKTIEGRFTKDRHTEITNEIGDLFAYLCLIKNRKQYQSQNLQIFNFDVFDCLVGMALNLDFSIEYVFNKWVSALCFIATHEKVSIEDCLQRNAEKIWSRWK